MPDAFNGRQQHLVLCGPASTRWNILLLSRLRSSAAIARCSCSMMRRRLSISARVAILRQRRQCCFQAADAPGEFQTAPRHCSENALPRFHAPPECASRTRQTPANIHRPLKLKHQQRLAHNSAAHAIRLGDVALRRQTRSHGIMPRIICARKSSPISRYCFFSGRMTALSTFSPVFFS